ncbi:MAG: sarcosine oxidase subunit delta [Thiolinea sp.]
MLLLECPYCKEARDEQEFSYAGEALIQRPALDCSDDEWGVYLFHRKNPKGIHLEQWSHALGCRKLFMVERSTIDNTIHAIRTFESLAADKQQAQGDEQ